MILWRNVIKKLKNERKNSIYAILGVSTQKNPRTNCEDFSFVELILCVSILSLA